MTTITDPQPRHVRYSARSQARLDAETHAKLEELARTFHRAHSAILRVVMSWGLTQTKAWEIVRSVPVASRSVHMLVSSELLEQVQDAAKAHDASAAAWLREAMWRITEEDFPDSWRAGEMSTRSHDSGHYQRRFMLRLDAETSTKLESLMQTFHTSAAEVIRQLIAQARPEAFPRSWQLAVEEQRQRAARPGEGER